MSKKSKDELTKRTHARYLQASKAEKSRILEAVKAGVNNYIVKPFTAESLQEKISQTMAKCGVS